MAARVELTTDKSHKRPDWQGTGRDEIVTGISFLSAVYGNSLDLPVFVVAVLLHRFLSRRIAR